MSNQKLRFSRSQGTYSQ